MAAEDKLDTALEVLAAHDIEPLDPEYPIEAMSEIGRVREGEAVYSTSLGGTFGEVDGVLPGIGPEDVLHELEGRLALPAPDGGLPPRLAAWEGQLQEIRGRAERQALPSGRDAMDWAQATQAPPPEPDCAWYCPIHFFGHGWGIYIREECVLHEALAIAQQTNWTAVAALNMSQPAIAQRLLRAAFYGLFLHEQFHHKVESLGFRLLVGSGIDRYRPYKWRVYRPTFLTRDCIEESLANADSYRRLVEDRYTKKLGAPFREALRSHLRASFALQPPGYREGLNLLSNGSFQPALHRLQSRVKDGVIAATTPPKHWQTAPDVIRSMMDVTAEIYVVLPLGVQPIFPVRDIDPRPGISTADMIRTLENEWGCQQVTGGKGSHVKLRTRTGEQIILPGGRDVLAPGIVVQVMRKVMRPSASFRDLDEFRRGARR